MTRPLPSNTRAIDQEIEKSYPFPLAGPWRRIHDQPDGGMRMDALLDAWRCATRWLSACFFADYLRGEPDPAVESWVGKWHQPSEGDIGQFVVKVAKALARRDQGERFLQEVSEWIEAPVADGVEETPAKLLANLVAHRNAETGAGTHGAAFVGPGQRLLKTNEAQQQMRLLLWSLGWMRRYPPVAVLRSDDRRIGYSGRLRAMVGPNQFLTASRQRWSARLARESVYLLDCSTQSLLDMYPFAQMTEPRQAPPQMVLIDGVDTCGRLLRRSLEPGVEVAPARPMTLDDREVALDQWLTRRREWASVSRLEGSDFAELSRLLSDKTDPGRAVASAVLGTRFEFLRPLGEGGMARVLLVKDETRGTLNALKTLKHNLAWSPDLARRLEEEAKIMSALPPSAHVIRIVDSGHLPDGSPFLLLPYAKQGSLKDHLVAGGVAQERLLWWVRDTLDGLQLLHAHGVVHRDLKPSNILIDGEEGTSGTAMLADFGVALAFRDVTLTGTGELLGSVPYMSPEVRNGGKASKASDVYSLGVVFHEALKGRRPRGTPGKGIAGPLGELVRLMTKEDPDSRISVDDCLERLDPLVGTQGPASALVVGSVQTSGAGRRSAGLPAVLAALGGAGIGRAIATPSKPELPALDSTLGAREIRLLQDAKTAIVALDAANAGTVLWDQTSGEADRRSKQTWLVHFRQQAVARKSGPSAGLPSWTEAADALQRGRDRLNQWQRAYLLLELAAFEYFPLKDVLWEGLSLEPSLLARCLGEAADALGFERSLGPELRTAIHRAARRLQGYSWSGSSAVARSAAGVAAGAGLAAAGGAAAAGGSLGAMSSGAAIAALGGGLLPPLGAAAGVVGVVSFLFAARRAAGRAPADPARRADSTSAQEAEAIVLQCAKLEAMVAFASPLGLPPLVALAVKALEQSEDGLQKAARRAAETGEENAGQLESGSAVVRRCLDHLKAR